MRTAMPQLTKNQELTHLYATLRGKIEDVHTLYLGWIIGIRDYMVGSRDRLCDSPGRLDAIGGASAWLSYHEDGSQTFTTEGEDERRQKRRALLKDMPIILAAIKSKQEQLARDGEDIRQAEFNEIIEAHFEINKARYVISVEKPILMVNGDAVKLNYMLDVLMPKVVILDHIELLKHDAENQLRRLKKKCNIEPDKYTNVVFVANEIVEAAEMARQEIIKAADLKDGLKQADAIMQAVYTENNEAILAEHRGYPIVNRIIECYRQLKGYFLLILTCPARLYDNKGVDTYMHTWFDPRSTSSMSVFGIFKTGMQSQNLLESNGIELKM
jgi:hypothetical protein